MQTRRVRTGPRDQLGEIYETERERIATEHQDVDACRKLWRTVIQRAVDDICFLRRLDGRRELKKHEQERLRRIRENPPTEFICDSWFEQVCDFLQVNPQRIREVIVSIGARAA